MQPLIVPPQSAAPLDPSAVVGKDAIKSDDIRKLPLGQTWYLFLGNLKEYAAAGANMAQYGTSAQRAALSAASAPDGGLFFETDTGLIYESRLVSGIPAWVFAAGTQIIDKTLTVASTTIANPTSGALDLVVILRQDATGGRAVVWGSNFAATTVAIDKTASTISTFRFVLSGGKYVQVGTETTGMTA